MFIRFDKQDSLATVKWHRPYLPVRTGSSFPTDTILTVDIVDYNFVH